MQVSRRRAQGRNGFPGQRLIAKKPLRRFLRFIRVTDSLQRPVPVDPNEPRRGSLSDRILIAENRCAAILRPLRRSMAGSLSASDRCRAGCRSSVLPFHPGRAKCRPYPPHGQAPGLAREDASSLLADGGEYFGNVQNDDLRRHVRARGQRARTRS
jgi:hypothetical protein